MVGDARSLAVHRSLDRRALRVREQTRSSLDNERAIVRKRELVTTDDPSLDPGLRAANLALSGRKHREVVRRAAIEIGAIDDRHAPWEVAAMFSVACLAVLLVLGLWFW